MSVSLNISLSSIFSVNLILMAFECLQSIKNLLPVGRLDYPQLNCINLSFIDHRQVQKLLAKLCDGPNRGTRLTWKVLKKSCPK